MLKSILVGVDGSPYSESAIDLGIRWAKQHSALLVGLGIIDEPAIAHPEPVPVGAAAFKQERDKARLAEARHKVDGLLERFTLECAQAGIAFKLLEDAGHPADQIVRESQRYDLVLLGRTTYFQLETSDEPEPTLLQVLKRGPRPVVAVPSAPLREAGSGGASVVVAYDGSPQAARALQAFQSLDLEEGRAMEVVCIEPSHARAAQVAERAMDFLRLHEKKATARPLVSNAAPGEVLLDYARQHNPAMVVMGAYGQPIWREFLFGSAARTMLNGSPVPLFLYH